MISAKELTLSGDVIMVVMVNVFGVSRHQCHSCTIGDLERHTAAVRASVRAAQQGGSGRGGVTL